MKSIQYNMGVGSNGRWQGSSILWYENASEFTGYHEKLIKNVENILSPDDIVCELACGSGTLSREIAKHVKHVYANELNEDAIQYLQETLSDNKVDNITSLPGDWREVCSGKQFDVVAYSYFSAITSDWEFLKSIAKKYIIAVIPSEKSASQHEHRETYEMVSKDLDKLNVDYSLIPLLIDFGQPFVDMDEVKEYLNHYYKFENDKEINDFISEKMKPLFSVNRDLAVKLGYTEKSMYFPKEKNIGIMIINTQDSVGL